MFMFYHKVYVKYSHKYIEILFVYSLDGCDLGCKHGHKLKTVKMSVLFTILVLLKVTHISYVLYRT